MHFRQSAAGAALLMFVATTVAGQSLGSRPERPSRALFGSGVGDVSQLLTAAGSLGAGFDTSVAADAQRSRTVGATDLDSTGDGIVTGLRASLGYSVDTEHVSLEGAAETAPRYYPGTHDRIFRRDHAAVSTDVRLPWALVASASVAYAPYSVLAFTRSDDGPEEAPGDEFPVSLEHYARWGAGLITSHRLTRRASVSADARYQSSGIGLPERRSRTVTGGGALRYQVGRNVFLGAGYHYAETEYSEARRYIRHMLDVGADARHDLSIARRTTLTFTTGTEIVTYPAIDRGGTEPDDAQEPQRGGSTRFHLSGTAELEHEMGRTWTATVTYRRGVQFLDGWPEPVLADAATARLAGSLSRRLQLSAYLRGSTGRGVAFLDDEGFSLVNGAASLTYAFTRHVNVGVMYSTYHHQFDEGIALPPGLGPWFDRHRIIAQVSAWTPLFSRSRRVNATR